MLRKALVLPIALMLTGAAGAQRTFKDLVPGVSTREDVARALGSPTRNVSKSLSEYPAPQGMARVEVEFDGGGIAQRIEVHLDPPVTRRALAESYGLSGADARKSRSGRLVEYFAGDALVSFTYVGAAESTGVASVGHFNRKAFSSASGLSLPDPTQNAGGGGAPGGSQPKTKTEKTLAVLNGINQVLGSIQSLRGQRSGWSVGNQATLEGTYLSQYQSPDAERCQADCGANGSCRAFVFVRPNNPNPGDPAMCYLMSSASRVVPSTCCVAGVKGGQ